MSTDILTQFPYNQRKHNTLLSDVLRLVKECEFISLRGFNPRNKYRRVK